MNNIKYFAILVIVLFASAITANAQFTVRPTAGVSTEKTIDTVRLARIDRPTPLNMSVYSEAYDRYLKRERFKYRNKVHIEASLGVNQASFDNWADGGGGVNSFSGTLFAKIAHKYNDEKKNFNVISIFEGKLAMQVADKKFTKGTDYFSFTVTPSWKFAPRWEISGSFLLKSQFSASFNDASELLSSFFAPANITLSAGITYSPPKNRFKFFFAPLSGDATLVLNKELSDKGLFGVPAGQTAKAEFGVFSRINFVQPFFKETTKFETKLEVFWNYHSVPRLTWDNTLSFKLNKLFDVGLFVRLIYNESVITPRAGQNNYWQINQTFGFNLRFDVQSKPNTVAYDQLGIF